MFAWLRRMFTTGYCRRCHWRPASIGGHCVVCEVDRTLIDVDEEPRLT